MIQATEVCILSTRRLGFALFGTHHTSMDTYDRLQREDLMQASVIMAAFVWNAATREGLLPRKPLPKAP